MNVYKFDPLSDPRWPAFLQEHEDASVFHTREWLSALKITYGFQPEAYTTSKGSSLENAVLFCELQSSLTGKRLVSLPFSDHCQPLATEVDLKEILNYLGHSRSNRSLKYIELRPLRSDPQTSQVNFGPFTESEKFHFHNVDLRPPAEAIYKRFHDSCIRRKIKRAEKEDLSYECGRTASLQKKFRHLLLLTRRRHKLPPQPASWFSNLASSFGEMFNIHVVSKGDDPVASIVTLRNKKTLTYKYGCSDLRFSNMGGTPLLFWKAIQQAKTDGLENLDLGRSDLEGDGLAAFKGHLGGEASVLQYYRTPAPHRSQSRSKPSGPRTLARETIARLPDPLFTGLGDLLYRHIG